MPETCMSADDECRDSIGRTLRTGAGHGKQQRGQSPGECPVGRKRLGKRLTLSLPYLHVCGREQAADTSASTHSWRVGGRTVG